MQPPSASFFMTSKTWLRSTRVLRWLVSDMSQRNPMEMPVYGMSWMKLFSMRVPSQNPSYTATLPKATSPHLLIEQSASTLRFGT